MTDFASTVEPTEEILAFFSSEQLSLSPFVDGSTIQNESIDISPPPYPTAPVGQYDYHQQPPTPALSTAYTESWKGEYGFEVAFEENGQATKSCSWTYSKELQRLYVKDNTVIPFHLRVTGYSPVMEMLFVRAHLKYSDHQYMGEPVTRCPNHASSMHPTNQNFGYPDHVVRAEGISQAVYSADHESVKSVRFQLPLPANGESYGYARFRFMCPNSCPGGMNRRSTDLLLVLENVRRSLMWNKTCLAGAANTKGVGSSVGVCVFMISNPISSGDEVGRFRTSIKICSCPGRDREKDEDKFERRAVGSNRSGSGGVVGAVGNKKKRPLPNQFSVTAPLPKPVKVTVEMLGDDLAEWIKLMAEKANAQRIKEMSSLSGTFNIPTVKKPHC